MRDDAREKKSLDLFNAAFIFRCSFFGEKFRSGEQFFCYPLHTLRSNSDLDTGEDDAKDAKRSRGRNDSLSRYSLVSDDSIWGILGAIVKCVLWFCY